MADKLKRTVKDIEIHICPTAVSTPHTHSFLELSYVEQGEAVHTLNGEKSVISKGDYFIIDYGAVHGYSSTGSTPLRIINCLFMPEFIDRTLYKCRDFSDVVNNYMLRYNYSVVNINPANYIFRDADGSIGELLHKMLDEYSEKSSGYHEILRCRLIEIIILTMRKSTSPEKVYTDKLCEYIIDYASTHLTDKNILGSIAKEVNFSTSYLSRKFRETTGTSFSEHLCGMRMEQCCRMLANTDKKITEIAYLAGYTDMKFFNSSFKKRLGITPSEFKKLHR